MLAEPKGIKADEKSQEKDDQKTDKSQDEVILQKKPHAKKADHPLEKNDYDDAKSKEKWPFREHGGALLIHFLVESLAEEICEIKRILSIKIKT